MLTKYIRAAMGKARYEILPDDGTFYGEIVGFDGVWAEPNEITDLPPAPPGEPARCKSSNDCLIGVCIDGICRR